ncbi:von Willebrand factor type A domain-containing protein [Coniochaeta sp. 2T2.1]|nr:von Willebrand factor type A domain-containing protein [Coniochaeta sp. 2T2.1]
MANNHGLICGFYYTVPQESHSTYYGPRRQYLPQVHLSVHTRIVSSTSRTTLTQNFVNPAPDKAIPELHYTFPLYDGVSVVGFTCTINNDRVIKGVVKERNEARKTYDDAVAKGETAGLLEQLPDASDVFTTTVGNVPGGAEIKVDITYLGELQHDAEVDGVRFTIPTSIAPRYGDYPGDLAKRNNVSTKEGIEIIVDAEMPSDSNIKCVQSPSHPISVTIGNTSSGAASGAAMSLQKASATLSLGTAELDKDFVVQIVATDTGNPVAILEAHPTLSNHRAIMTTLVPKFNLPSARPEIVFVCDRSGSMGRGRRIPHLKAALQIFLKSLPLGVKFNICSFGSRHELLSGTGSVSYDASSVDKATKYVEGFAANFGGTEMYRPLEDIIQKRHKDMDLEIFLLTDGEVWDQYNLINLINKSVEESRGTIRLFTLGIGDSVSHALIEGLARAGNGFSQAVLDNEKMNSKVLRMLKAALTPHVKDYTLEVKYEPKPNKTDDEDADFEIIEKVMDALTVDVAVPASEDKSKSLKSLPSKTISLFDPTADPDVEMLDSTKDATAGGKYSAVPPVSEPRLLQAPFIIPALYPFNRTSVYLLLSPDTTQQTPKSIVLRGTSAYGPLELEIPVTILPEKAETIHQLAARKAIRELEDGRGWIFHAKDTGDGTLLKAKYPGRFPDMVEREAVRLGVKFQVGGKWCSFVAVDEKDVMSSVTETERRQPSLGSDNSHSPRVSDVRAWGSRSYGGRGSMPGGFQSRNYKPMPTSQPFAMGGSSEMRMLTLGAPSPAPMMGVPAASSTCSSNSFKSLSHSSREDSSSPGVPGGPRLNVFGSKAAPRQASCEESSPRTRGLMSRDPSARMESRNYRGSSSLDTEDCLSEPAAAPTDVLETIVALQTFDGYWKWTDQLFSRLSLDGDLPKLQAQMSSNNDITALGADLDAPSDKLATAIVLAFLETKMKERKDEWEMLAEKAYRWLDTTLSDEAARRYVAIVSDHIYGA